MSLARQCWRVVSKLSCLLQNSTVSRADHLQFSCCSVSFFPEWFLDGVSSYFVYTLTFHSQHVCKHNTLQVPSGKIATLLGTVASSDHLLPSVVMMGVTCRRLLIISFELHIIFVGFSLLFSVVCFVLLFVVFAVSYSNWFWYCNIQIMLTNFFWGMSWTADLLCHLGRFTSFASFKLTTYLLVWSNPNSVKEVSCAVMRPLEK